MAQNGSAIPAFHPADPVELPGRDGATLPSIVACHRRFKGINMAKSISGFQCDFFATDGD